MVLLIINTIINKFHIKFLNNTLKHHLKDVLGYL